MIEAYQAFGNKRSTNRFIKNVQKSEKRHAELLEEGRLSLPNHMGILAIRISTFHDHNSLLSPDDQLRAFHEEGERLKDDYGQTGEFADVRLYEDTNHMEMSFDLADREVASIITIGHGCLGSLSLGHGRKNYDWHDVAKSVRHLKQGFIEQRTCGTVAKDAKTVPWGVFALADQRQLRVAAGQTVPDEDPDDGLFQPIFDKKVNSAKEILQITETYRSKD